VYIIRGCCPEIARQSTRVPDRVGRDMTQARKPNPELDAQILRLRDEERLTFGEITGVIARTTGRYYRVNSIAVRFYRARARSQSRDTSMGSER
jgi:hypothetical protein